MPIRDTLEYNNDKTIVHISSQICYGVISTKFKIEHKKEKQSDRRIHHFCFCLFSWWLSSTIQIIDRTKL